MELETRRCGYDCRAQDPYPEVRAQGRNPRYAEAILSNVGGSNSEMTAVSLYFYDHLVTAGVPEVAQAFHAISEVEMHHLEIFGTLALQLGADPRLWSAQQGRRVWWTPEYNHYARKLGPIIQDAVRSERACIRKYESQLRWIRDENVVANLRRILQDEHLHLDMLSCLYTAYVGTGMPPGC